MPCLAGKTILAGGAFIAAKKDKICAQVRLLPHSFYDFLEAIIFGTAAEWAVFEILAVPMILKEQPFSLLQRTWLIVMAAGIGLGIAFTVFRNRKIELPVSVVNIEPDEKAGALNRWGIMLLAGLMLLAGFQSFMYVKGMHIDWDDSRFIAHTVEAYSHGNMLTISPTTGEYIGLQYWDGHKDAIAPWPIFLALLAKLSGIHPTILAHTVLPPIYLLLTYGVYWLLGKRLFQDDTNRSILFTSVIAFIMLFYDALTYSQADFILVRLWQGKAVLAAIGIPLIFFLFLLAAEKGSHVLWMLLPVVLGCSLLSSVTIPVLGFCMAGCSLCYLFFTRKWKSLLPLALGVAPLLFLALLDMRIR